MRGMLRGGLLVVATLAFAACASARPSPSAQPKPDTAQACAEWRVIAVRSRGVAQCPVIRGWRGEPLFKPSALAERDPKGGAGYATAAAAGAEDRRGELAAELDRFCVYEAEDGHGRRAGRPFPAAPRAELVRADQDCAALGIAADPLAPAVWHAASEQLFAQVGKPPEPLAVKNERAVRLAFLDTQPTGVGVPHAPGTSQHGYTLTHIARHLVCSPASGERCAAQITTRLALPITGFDPRSRTRTAIDRAHGGYVGMQSDLAGAIVGEVDDWLAARHAEHAPRHLVLNLSLAWDPRLFGGLSEREIAELRAGTQAVYRALQYAANLDVLVLGAAGNKKICPGVPPDGPLLPAAWERGGARSQRCERDADAPLIYAVGGLGADGNALWNGRPEGMPRRAAYGEHAVVATFDPAVPTAMYTGTSVSTAVASSIAALVWDTIPSLSSRQVMALLDGSDHTMTSMAADFWFGETPGEAPPRVRRLSVCEALAEACARPGATGCPLVGHCAPWAPGSGTIPGLTDDHSLGGTCQPWIFPQPEDPPCPNCIKEPPRG